jgi:hypothetical protein
MMLRSSGFARGFLAECRHRAAASMANSNNNNKDVQLFSTSSTGAKKKVQSHLFAFARAPPPRTPIIIVLPWISRARARFATADERAMISQPDAAAGAPPEEHSLNT